MTTAITKTKLADRQKQLSYRLNPRKYKDKCPKFFAAADTETDEHGYAIVFSIYGYNRRGEFISEVFTEYNFFEMRSKIETILKQFSHVYFHNLEFDISAIFRTEWVTNDTKFKNIFRSSGILLSKLIYSKSIKTQLIDSFAILPKSLKQIGEIIGEHKIETTNYKDEKYCLQDSKVLYKSVEFFFKTLRANNIYFSYTLPSIYVKTLQTTLTSPILRPPDKQLEFIRASYKGGRNEIFKVGKHEKVFAYDIVSAYPYAMSNIRLALPYPNKRGNKLLSSKDKYQIVACKIHIPTDNYIPCLGIRYNNKLMFPTGNFVGYFSNMEIEHAIKYNNAELLDVRKTIDFDYFEVNPLKKLTEKLFELKNSALSPAESYVFKIILNGGYGKFGQWKYITEYSKELNTIVRTETNKIPAFANQIWASQITSFIRCYLFVNMVANQSGITYVDTDCIHSTIKINQFEKNKKQLGNFVKEFEGYANYINCKFYQLGDKYKVKGVPAKYQRWVFNHKAVYYTRPIRIKTAIKFNKDVNVWKGSLKHLSGNYDKRIISNNGVDTAPIEINTNWE